MTAATLSRRCSNHNSSCISRIARSHLGVFGASALTSMTAEYEVLEWKHQCLEAQNQRMNERKRIHDMKSEGP
jgi:hypothetical protein